MNETTKSVAVLTIVLALSLTLSTRPVSASTASEGNVGQVVATVPVGGFLGDMAVDSANGNVYVGRGSGGGNMLSIISGSSNTLIGAVNLGPDVVGTGHPGFDSANGNLYVPVCSPFPCDPGNVTVVSTLSNTVVASFPVLAVPAQALYDPANGLLYVTDRGNGGAGAGLSVIDPLTNTIVKTFSASQVGQAPLGEAYDSATGNLYVADQFNTNDIIYVISESTNTVVATVQTPPSIGAGPCSITYDSQNGDLYVAMCDGHTVTIISGTTNTVVGTIFLLDGTATLDYDSANNNVYVPSGGSNNKVSVISGATSAIVGSITVGNGPVDAVYDSFNRDVYVSNQGSGTVSVISTSTGCVAPPSGLVSWWPLDGNANDIRDGNTGTVVGSGGQFVPGEVGLGFQSGGPGSLVQVNDEPNLHLTQLTVDAWVKINAINPSIANMAVVSKGDNLGTDITIPYGIWVVANPGSVGPRPNAIITGTLAPGKLFGIISNGTVEQDLVTDSPVPVGSFFHVALTADGSTVRLYINGQIAQEALQAVQPFASTFPFQIGSLSNTPTASFLNGIVDEVEAYNRALTPLEVQSIFTAGSSGKCKLGIHVSKFFTDPNLNPLPLDSNGNPEVNVTLAGGVVRSSNPGQVLAWVNVTNTSVSSLQSLKLNDTLPVDWRASPAWMPAKGAIHVFYANTTSLATNPDITQPSTITVSTGNPQSVSLFIPSFNATLIGHPLMPGQGILLSVKLTYALKGTSQSASSYPRNYTDTAVAAAWTQTVFGGTEFTGNASAFFVADAKIVH